MSAVSTPTRRRPAVIALWVLQVLLGVFFVAASGLPKLVGESTAVDTFTQIGAGQWLRYLIGFFEVAGGIGLLVPRLAGLAAGCLVALMVGALIFTFAALDTTFWYTPVILGVLCAIVAVARRGEVAALRRR